MPATATELTYLQSEQVFGRNSQCRYCAGPVRFYRTPDAKVHTASWLANTTPHGGSYVAHKDVCTGGTGVQTIEPKPKAAPAPAPTPQAPPLLTPEAHESLKAIEARVQKAIEAGTAMALANLETLKANRIAQSDAANTAAIQALTKTRADFEKALAEALEQTKAALKTPREITITSPGKKPKTIKGAHHHAFPMLVKLAGAGIGTYLFGPPGSGKGHAAHAVAEALDLPYHYMALAPGMTPSALLGYKDLTGSFQSTAFADWCTQGGVLFVDEADNAQASLLTLINEAASNGRTRLATGPVNLKDAKHRHVIIAAGNTNGQGPRPGYADRRPMDAATMPSRLRPILWEYDRDLELSIASEYKTGKAAHAWIGKAREYAASRFPRMILCSRTMVRIAQETTIGFDFKTEVFPSVHAYALDNSQAQAFLSAVPFNA